MTDMAEGIARGSTVIFLSPGVFAKPRRKGLTADHAD